MLERDRAAGGTARPFAFTATAAKYLSNAMAYDGILRVADLKTRRGRSDRIADKKRATPGTLVQVTEYFHPGAGEVAGLLPRRLGG